MTIAAQRMRRTLQVDRVPQHDGRRHQVEAAGPVALLLETAVTDFTKAVEEHGTGQRPQPGDGGHRAVEHGLPGACGACVARQWSCRR